MHKNVFLLWIFFAVLFNTSRAAAPTPETCAGTLDPNFFYGTTIRPTQIVPDGDKLIVAHQ